MSRRQERLFGLWLFILMSGVLLGRAIWIMVNAALPN